MEWIRKSFFTKSLAMYLAFALFVIGSLPAQSLAYMVGSQAGEVVFDRIGDMANVQRVLESKAVSQRLSELGLTMEEIKVRLANLTDAELHQFATSIDSIHAGGDGLGVVISILLIIVLVLTIFHLTGHKIIVK